jgi:hypothetical protein
MILFAVVLSLLLLGSTFLDWYLTTEVIAQGGKELNPVVRWLVERVGWEGVLIIKMVAAVVGVAVFLLTMNTYITLLIAGWAIAQSAVCGYNYKQLK